MPPGLRAGPRLRRRIGLQNLRKDRGRDDLSASCPGVNESPGLELVQALEPRSLGRLELFAKPIGNRGG